MKYIVLSTAVTDEIHFADGSCKEKIAGGAGIYALAGLKIWNDDVMIVTGVGKDYFESHVKWYEKNNISTDGLIVKHEHTPHTIIEYFQDDERSETPKYGVEHYKLIEATPEDLEKYCADTKGVYIFKNASQPFWNEILRLKNKYKFTLMWEIGCDATIPENLELIKDIASRIDIFSINKTEALNLMNTTKIDEAIDIFIEWNLPFVYLRAGSKGSYAISNGKAIFVSSIQNIEVIDVTGGGNSSSGGALVGYCETGDAVKSAKMGNISAAFCIGQYGVPEVIDEELRKKAYEMLKG